MAGSSGSAVVSNADTTQHGRFLPGTMLTERYRIVGLLGRGGMGEVYRADDLELGQSVALKFLPEQVIGDPSRLSRFRNEVRIARQVSHPNVCRVYDIARAEDDHFLSMEYVDGEDLAVVLKRMGRPSKDKAIQIARQLCAGLAAAHENGVLHRDLKPHNVIIDGRGRARITDFGLAGLVDSFHGDEIRHGTPAYMAPEQLAGRQVSIRSDIYALGVVLYELFTGERVFGSNSISELRRLHEGSTVATPSSLVEDIDPAVERVILRCLEKDPRQRPSSALAVAAALPGGDPLAAALAAGETPSPEMVANAGEIGGMRPAHGVICLVAFLIGLALVALLSGKRQLVHRVPMPHPPEVLTAKAREIVQQLGYSDTPVDSAHGFIKNQRYLDHIVESDKTPNRWEQLAAGRPAAIRFWYRQSPRFLVPKGFFLMVDLDDPPPDLSGMVHIQLDTQGRLLSLLAVPPQRDAPNGRPEDPDWTQLFPLAGLDPAQFTPVRTEWTPEVWSDTRMAWEGVCPPPANIPLRVEAAAYRGRPVFFKLIWPWTRPSRMQRDPVKTGEWAANMIAAMLFLCILIGGILVARRNLRLGRGDRRGGLRLLLFILVVILVGWLFGADHVPTFWELGLFVRAASWGTFVAALVWILYIALEPYVRRHWPQALISWNRLLMGRIRDPLVGRDILLGGLYGVAILLIGHIRRWIPALLGSGPAIPDFGSKNALLDMRFLIATVCDNLPASIFFPLGLFFLLFLCRILLRRPWIYTITFILIIGTGSFLEAENLITGLMGVLWVVLFVVVLTRFGLFAIVAGFFISGQLSMFPVTLDFSTWYAGASIFALALCAAIGFYGFRTALAGRPILKDQFLGA